MPATQTTLGYDASDAEPTPIDDARSETTLRARTLRAAETNMRTQHGRCTCCTQRLLFLAECAMMSTHARMHARAHACMHERTHAERTWRTRSCAVCPMGPVPCDSERVAARTVQQVLQGRQLQHSKQSADGGIALLHTHTHTSCSCTHCYSNRPKGRMHDAHHQRHCRGSASG